ncbi:MAG: hypothetical protein U0W40_01870 [Acidimicrobiia bacterium]
MRDRRPGRTDLDAQAVRRRERDGVNSYVAPFALSETSRASVADSINDVT